MSKVIPTRPDTSDAFVARAITSSQVNDLHLTLTEAHALIDTIYTATGNRIVGELCEGTAGITLHVAMQKLEHALEVLESPREVQS